MKKLLFGLCFVACLSACATSSMVQYQVNSTPPGAHIYVNNVLMGIAPIQVELQCDKQWACPAGDSCHWESHHDDVDEVTAFPANDNLGPSQTKRVSACDLKAQLGYIDFNFGPDSGQTMKKATR